MKMKSRVKKHSLKLLSALLAVFLWVYVLNSEKVKFEKTVTIEYILPQNMVFAEKPLTEVAFLIEGPRAFVKNVAERDEKIIIDLNRINKKRLLNFWVNVESHHLNLPFGMAVERVLPRRLHIKLEKRAGKIVPIKVRFAGQLPDELSLAKYEVIPPEVEVTGPQSQIMKLKEVQTIPVELETMIGLSEVPIELKLGDQLSAARGQSFFINYQLKAVASNQVLKNVRINFLTQNSKVDSRVKTAEVHLMIPDKLKNRSNISSSIQVWADIPERAKGKVEVPLRAIVPTGVILLEISPKSIIVNVR